ncbi:Ku protein [Myxococcota bacterium]|nr:Ku protein [Myxococcota bacterium]
MAARSIATATISFGLVSIPVRLYAATDASAGISFNMLHKKCGGRLKQQYICPRDDDEVVPRTETVRGYEFAKDQYVIFTEDELKELQEKATQSIDITEFVPSEKVPPIYYEKSYYLGPDKGGDRAYKLLSEAMRQTGRSALAKYAARGKMYLVLVTPHDEGLVLHQLYYADEVRSFSEVPVGDADVKDGELRLAMQLVEQIASDDFRPEKYEDEVKTRIEAIIQRKVEGQEVQLGAPEAPKAEIIDLMEALKASLGAASDAEGSAAAEAADERKGPMRAAVGDEGSEAEAPKKRAKK